MKIWYCPLIFFLLFAQASLGSNCRLNGQPFFISFYDCSNTKKSYCVMSVSCEEKKIEKISYKFCLPNSDSTCPAYADCVKQSEKSSEILLDRSYFDNTDKCIRCGGGGDAPGEGPRPFPTPNALKQKKLQELTDRKNLILSQLSEIDNQLNVTKQNAKQKIANNHEATNYLVSEIENQISREIESEADAAKLQLLLKKKEELVKQLKNAESMTNGPEKADEYRRIAKVASDLGEPLIKWQAIANAKLAEEEANRAIEQQVDSLFNSVVPKKESLNQELSEIYAAIDNLDRSVPYQREFPNVRDGMKGVEVGSSKAIETLATDVGKVIEWMKDHGMTKGTNWDGVYLKFKSMLKLP